METYASARISQLCLVTHWFLSVCSWGWGSPSQILLIWEKPAFCVTVMNSLCKTRFPVWKSEKLWALERHSNRPYCGPALVCQTRMSVRVVHVDVTLQSLSFDFIQLLSVNVFLLLLHRDWSADVCQSWAVLFSHWLSWSCLYSDYFVFLFIWNCTWPSFPLSPSVFFFKERSIIPLAPWPIRSLNELSPVSLFVLCFSFLQQYLYISYLFRPVMAVWTFLLIWSRSADLCCLLESSSCTQLPGSYADGGGTPDIYGEQITVICWYSCTSTGRWFQIFWNFLNI